MLYAADVQACNHTLPSGMIKQTRTSLVGLINRCYGDETDRHGSSHGCYGAGEKNMKATVHSIQQNSQ